MRVKQLQLRNSTKHRLLRRLSCLLIAEDCCLGDLLLGQLVCSFLQSTEPSIIITSSFTVHWTTATMVVSYTTLTRLTTTTHNQTGHLQDGHSRTVQQSSSPGCSNNCNTSDPNPPETVAIAAALQTAISRCYFPNVDTKRKKDRRIPQCTKTTTKKQLLEKIPTLHIMHKTRSGLYSSWKTNLALGWLPFFWHLFSCEICCIFDKWIRVFYYYYCKFV